MKINILNSTILITGCVSFNLSIVKHFNFTPMESVSFSYGLTIIVGLFFLALCEVD
jgi:hypothetical protein